MSNPNLALLTAMAKRLRPLLEELVFVGGCTTGLLVSDTASAPIRPTTDVDVMVEIVSRAAYYTLAERLRELGFQEDTADNAPICRWIIDSMVLDVLPTDPAILGFSNRWYPDALQAAQPFVLAEGLVIRLITAPHFLATKLEAFYGRGQGDFLFSHDLEDIVTVIDGRPALADEIQAANPALRAYLAAEFAALLRQSAFHDALPGFLPGDNASQQRLPGVIQLIGKIANLDG